MNPEMLERVMNCRSLPTLPAVWVDLPGRLAAGARTFAEAGGADGYFGDPARASAEEGHRLLAALGEMVVTAVIELGDPAGFDRPAAS